MFCPNCGNNSTGKFCGSCGTSLDENSTNTAVSSKIKNRWGLLWLIPSILAVLTILTVAAELFIAMSASDQNAKAVASLSKAKSAAATADSDWSLAAAELSACQVLFDSNDTYCLIGIGAGEAELEMRLADAESKLASANGKVSDLNREVSETERQITNTNTAMLITGIAGATLTVISAVIVLLTQRRFRNRRNHPEPLLTPSEET